jgi:hypothetical protein
LQSVTQSFDNFINNTFLKPKDLDQQSPPTPTPKQAHTQMIRNQEEPSGKNIFRDLKYEEIQALAPSIQAKGNNPGAKFKAAWSRLWDACQNKAHYERLATLDKRYVSLYLFYSHSLTLVQRSRASNPRVQYLLQHTLTFRKTRWGNCGVCPGGIPERRKSRHLPVSWIYYDLRLCIYASSFGCCSHPAKGYDSFDKHDPLATDNFMQTWHNFLETKNFGEPSSALSILDIYLYTTFRRSTYN